LKNNIPKIIFFLVKKTVRSLGTPEIVKIIIKSVIYTGIAISILLGVVKLLLGVTVFVEWGPEFLESAIDNFIFWISMTIGWFLIPIFIPLISSFLNEKIVYLIQTQEYENGLDGQGASWDPEPNSSIIDLIPIIKIFLFSLLLNLLIIPLMFLDTVRPLLKFISTFTLDNMFLAIASAVSPILYILINSLIFGIEFFANSTTNQQCKSKDDQKLQFYLFIFFAGGAIFFFSLIPILNLITPVIGITFMVHLSHFFLYQSSVTEIAEC
jgi:hypothetical protein